MMTIKELGKASQILQKELKKINKNKHRKEKIMKIFGKK
jgi:hypothetical protein